jgi:hypothetical protein
MMKKIADMLPAVFTGVGSGAILTSTTFHYSQTVQRVVTIIDWPWSMVWLATIFAGSAGVIVGISLRSRHGKIGRPQIWGQGLELAGNLAVGSMFVVYALILNAQFPFWMIFPSLCWFGALASTFLGPWAVIVRDIIRAHRSRDEY